MKQLDILSSEGRKTIIESEFFRIEGSKIQLSQIIYDPYNISYQSLGFEDEPVYTIPPHIMEELGIALLKSAEKEYSRLQSLFKKEAKKLLEYEKSKK